jgi:hypothetical protein
VPCRAGSKRAVELARGDLGANGAALRAVLAAMRAGSLCAFGRDTPGPIEAVLARTGAA